MSQPTNWIQRFLTAALAALLATVTVPAQADETITYIHWDALGSPVAATDEGGNVVWREGYRPYGERINHEAAAGPHSRWYTGHSQDADTGLVYAGARYYDPQIGRFLGIDPVGVQGDNLHSFNRYAYANNNPYSYVDPDGESPVDTVFLAVDLVRLGYAAVTGGDVTGAAIDVGLSAVGVASPVPGTGVALKAGRAAKRAGRSGKQTRLREIMDDPKASSADRGWLKNDARHVKTGNKPGLRVPRNGRRSPGRKAEDKGYELGHPRNKPASQGNSHGAGSKLKNHADHRVETRLHRKRY